MRDLPACEHAHKARHLSCAARGYAVFRGRFRSALALAAPACGFELPTPLTNGERVAGELVVVDLGAETMEKVENSLNVPALAA